MSLRIKDNTDDILREVNRKKEAFVLKGGLEAGAEMRRRAPVGVTGQTRGSITTETGIDSGQVYSDTGPTAKWAPFVEFGTGRYVTGGRQTPWTYYDEQRGTFVTTHGQPAQPFAEPGWQAALPKIERLALKDFEL